MSEKILYVDDDPSVLAAYKRGLRRTSFIMQTAIGGQEGLKALDEQGPFAVVISDMRMPGMDGVQFLAQVKERSPDTVRMMLTGNADLTTAMEAVNKGCIFRFLTKPCPNDVLVEAMSAGIRQYQLVTSERVLLEETLNASIKMLTDVLSLVNPMAFGRAARLRLYVQHIVQELGLPDAWQFQTAAMLSQLGWVTLPPETMEKVYAGQELTAEEEELFASHPTVASRLLVTIPRLEDVAHMIARQEEPFSWHKSVEDAKHRELAALGGHILKVALDFDRMVTRGASPEDAIEAIQSKTDLYDWEIVQTLHSLHVRQEATQVVALNVDRLDAQMILDQDIRAKNGNLLVTRGQELTFPILERLHRWAHGTGVQEPIRVRVPRRQLADQPA